MGIFDFLDKSGVNYEVSEHHPTFTAQRLAAEEHEPGKFVAKPVIVKAEDRFIMCVIGACFKVDISALKEQLDAKNVELADEKDIALVFPDCEIGAEPPFGNLYGIDTIMDRSLTNDDHIIFQGGSHKTTIRMNMADYRKLAKPKVLDFSYHLV